MHTNGLWKMGSEQLTVLLSVAVVKKGRLNTNLNLAIVVQFYQLGTYVVEFSSLFPSSPFFAKLVANLKIFFHSLRIK